MFTCLFIIVMCPIAEDMMLNAWRQETGTYAGSFIKRT